MAGSIGNIALPMDVNRLQSEQMALAEQSSGLIRQAQLRAAIAPIFADPNLPIDKKLEQATNVYGKYDALKGMEMLQDQAKLNSQQAQAKTLQDLQSGQKLVDTMIENGVAPEIINSTVSTMASSSPVFAEAVKSLMSSGKPFGKYDSKLIPDKNGNLNVVYTPVSPTAGEPIVKPTGTTQQATGGTVVNVGGTKQNIDDIRAALPPEKLMRTAGELRSAGIDPNKLPSTVTPIQTTQNGSPATAYVFTSITHAPEKVQQQLNGYSATAKGLEDVNAIFDRNKQLKPDVLTSIPLVGSFYSKFKNEDWQAMNSLTQALFQTYRGTTTGAQASFQELMALANILPTASDVSRGVFTSKLKAFLYKLSSDENSTLDQLQSQGYYTKEQPRISSDPAYKSLIENGKSIVNQVSPIVKFKNEQDLKKALNEKVDGKFLFQPGDLVEYIGKNGKPVQVKIKGE